MTIMIWLGSMQFRLANEDFGVFLLNEEYYNDKYGVVREAEMPLLLM